MPRPLSVFDRKHIIQDITMRDFLANDAVYLPVSTPKIFHPRIAGVLEISQIYFIGQFATQTTQDILDIRNISCLSLQDIRGGLAKLGLAFPVNIIDKPNDHNFRLLLEAGKELAPYLLDILEAKAAEAAKIIDAFNEQSTLLQRSEKIPADPVLVQRLEGLLSRLALA